MVPIVCWHTSFIILNANVTLTHSCGSPSYQLIGSLEWRYANTEATMEQETLAVHMNDAFLYVDPIMLSL